MQEQPTTRTRFQFLVRRILDQNPSKQKLSTSKIIPIDLSKNPSQVSENRSSSLNTSGFQRKSTIGRYWQSIVSSKVQEDSDLNNSKLDTSIGKRSKNKLHSLVSSFIKNRKKTNNFISEIPKELGPEVVKRKFHRAFHILRSLHRLNRISGDIQLYGTSSNLFDLTTRDRIRVKKILYPSVLDEAEQHLREEKDMKWYVLHPKGRARVVWSLVMVFLLVYTATIMPYRLTFEEITPFSWQIVDYFVDALFLTDFAMNFISAYYDEEGHFIKEPKTLALNYMKSWFILDLIAVFPLDIIENVVIDNDTTSSSKVRYNFFLRLIRIPRLYRLVKIVKLNSLFKFIRGNKALEWLELNSIIMKLASFFIVVVTVVHIMACLWYFVARLDNNDPETWIARNQLEGSPNASVYLASLYYVISTLATVGYGDIYSETIPEKILTIIWMILGVGFYSFTVGMIASIFSSRENRESSLKRKISIANEFAKEIKAPKSLKARIRKILEYNSLRNCFSWANKKDIFSEIPISLRYEIIMAMHDGILGTIPFFREHSDKYFVVTIAEILKPLQVAARDFLWKEGDSAESIYFLITGKVHLLSSEFLTPEDQIKNQKTSIIFKRFMGGSYFGEIELINKRKRGYTLQASSNAELFYITKHDYFNILMVEFPHIHEEFKEIALARDKHDGVSLAEIRSFLFAHIPEERKSSKQFRSRQNSLAQAQPSRSNSTSSNRLKATLTHMSSLDPSQNKTPPIKSTDEIKIPEIASPTNQQNSSNNKPNLTPPAALGNFLPEVKFTNLLSPTHSPKVQQNTSLSEKRHNSYTSLHNMAQLDKLSPVLKDQTPSDDQSPRMDNSWSPSSLPKGSSRTSSDSSSDSSDSSDSSSDSKPVSKPSLFPISPSGASPVHSDQYQERRRSANPFFSPSKKLDEFPSSARIHRSNSSLATPIIKDTGGKRGSIRISSALKPGAVISSVPRKGQRKRTKEVSFLKMAAGVDTEEDSSPDTKGSYSSADKRAREELSREVKKPPLSGSNQNSIRTDKKPKEERKKSEFFNQSKRASKKRDTIEAENLKNTIKDSNKRMENLENRFQDAMNALEGLMNID